MNSAWMRPDVDATDGAKDRYILNIEYQYGDLIASTTE